MQDLVQCKLLGETSVSVSTIDFKEHMIESRQADAIYVMLHTLYLEPTRRIRYPQGNAHKLETHQLGLHVPS
jgi:hypothetical protein